MTTCEDRSDFLSSGITAIPDYNDDCPICLEHKVAATQFKACKHVFCHECTLVITKLEPIALCPLCRRRLWTELDPFPRAQLRESTRARLLVHIEELVDFDQVYDFIVDQMFKFDFVIAEDDIILAVGLAAIKCAIREGTADADSMDGLEDYFRHAENEFQVETVLLAAAAMQCLGPIHFERTNIIEFGGLEMQHWHLICLILQHVIQDIDFDTHLDLPRMASRLERTMSQRRTDDDWWQEDGFLTMPVSAFFLSKEDYDSMNEYPDPAALLRHEMYILMLQHVTEVIVWVKQGTTAIADGAVPNLSAVDSEQ